MGSANIVKDFVNAFWETWRYCRFLLLSTSFAVRVLAILLAISSLQLVLCSGVHRQSPQVLHLSRLEEDLLLQGRAASSYHNLQQAASRFDNRTTASANAGDYSTDGSTITYSAASSPQRVDSSKNCGTAEEMGAASVGDSRHASLRVRKMIQDHLEEHGATKIRKLPEKMFCQRSFVLARSMHDGLGNNLYKILTGAGLSILLNRSLIMGEAGTKNMLNMSSAHPEIVSTKLRLKFLFGDYIEYSPEILSLQETRALWVTNGCESRYGRPLTLRTVPYTSLANPSLLCDDWTTYTEPIVQLWAATDSSALQVFQKSRHAVMRELAGALLGNSWDPDSRPNTFGELARVLMKPKANVQRAIEWTLRGRAEPDVVLHVRHGNHGETMEAASLCVLDALNRSMPLQHGTGAARVAIVADDPIATNEIAKMLEGKVEVIKFDYKRFLAENRRVKRMRSWIFSVPEKRRDDWGPAPRWVAVVEFFLASLAQRVFVSAARLHVGTTFAQLAAAIAAANQLDENCEKAGVALYCSFHRSVLKQGLRSQHGRGFSWHTFGGSLACLRQERQCALTTLMPYAWWDHPWQSPARYDMKELKANKLVVEHDGRITKEAIERFCRLATPDVEMVHLVLPKCEDIEACRTRELKDLE